MLSRVKTIYSSLLRTSLKFLISHRTSPNSLWNLPLIRNHKLIPDHNWPNYRSWPISGSLWPGICHPGKSVKTDAESQLKSHTITKPVFGYAWHHRDSLNDTWRVSTTRELTHEIKIELQLHPYKPKMYNYWLPNGCTTEAIQSIMFQVPI